MFLGAVFGLIFGFMDVEDFTSADELHEKLFSEERVCLPIGFLVGGVAAYYNNILRKEFKYSPLGVDYESSSSHNTF